MRLILVLCVLLTTCVWGVEDAPKQVKHRQGPAVAEGPVIREVWSNRLNPQGRLGWVQTLSYYVEEQGKKLIRTVVRDHIRYLRSGDPYMEENEQYSLEDEEGTVLEVTVQAWARIRIW
ncbi:MAG TPA: hypothetical protein PKD72_01785 [Gemmatales bacterium]|nr:hypothetical protein [Gemmatales bacterium]